MTCINPFKLKKPEGGVMELPCGRCIACKIAKSREWASRIIHEMVYYNESVFVTLTYDQDHLPVNNSISKEDIQKFLKRLRKDIYPKKIRYFLCGEYGDQSQRPHYHLIIFGLGRNEKQLISENWGKGLIHCGTVTFQSARYVARYIEKKYDGKKEQEAYKDKGLVTPFCYQSKGLGKQFAIDNHEYLEQNLGFTVQGAKCGLPRYYRTLHVRDKDSKIRFPVLDVDKNDFIAQAIEKGKGLIEHYMAKGEIDRDDYEWSVNEAKKKAREQAEKTLNAKINLHPKKI